jgi:hypothetical protein
MTALRVLIAILFLVGVATGQEPVPGTFRAVDLFVDSGNQPLAAYQLSFAVADARIVGIEGGEHSAFSEPPYYDPQAMRTNHAIIAAFSTATGDQLPRGRIRIATVHLRILSGGTLDYQLNVQTAATPLAERISISAEAKERTRL